MENFYWFILFVGLNGLLLFVLMANVSRLRLRYQISLGDGGNEKLNAAIRAHANGIEQVPWFAVILLALCHLAATSWIMAALVGVFTFARLAHAYGMLSGVFIGRRIGAALSFLCQLLAPLAVLVLLITG